MIVDWKYTNSVEIGQPKLSEPNGSKRWPVCNTYESFPGAYSRIEDYGMKVSTTTELSRGAFYPLSSGKSKRDSSLSSVKKNNRYSFLS